MRRFVMTKARYQWSIPRQTIEIEKQIIKKFNI